jgi:hypothetical protein
MQFPKDSAAMTTRMALSFCWTPKCLLPVWNAGILARINLVMGIALSRVERLSTVSPHLLPVIGYDVFGCHKRCVKPNVKVTGNAKSVDIERRKTFVAFSRVVTG